MAEPEISYRTMADAVKLCGQGRDAHAANIRRNPKRSNADADAIDQWQPALRAAWKHLDAQARKDGQ